MTARVPTSQDGLVPLRAWLLLAPLLGCGLPDGADRYATDAVLDEPSGDYRLRYLSPPWELVSSAGSTAELAIESIASAFVELDGGIPPIYRLVVTVEPGAAEARAREDEGRAPSREESVVAPTRPVRTDSGDAGFEVLTRGTGRDPRFRRYSYFTHPRGVVRMFFEAVPDLSEPEVDAMVRSLDVRPGDP